MDKRLFAWAAIVLSLSPVAGRAAASQVFVCGDGRTVAAATADIERLRRTDPCVAAHFGEVVQRAVLPATPTVPLPKRRPERVGTVRADEAREQGPTGPKIEVAGSARAAEPTSEMAPGERLDGARVTLMRPAIEPESVRMERALAELGAGTFDRVKVINAGTPSRSWFVPK
ncbi:MAG: hypothetical protein ACFCUN_04905 [Hyphomicrobiaceae bacterium]